MSASAMPSPEWIRDRCGGENEARLGAVCEREPPQSPQHVRNVGAEHAAIDVRLVDDDEREVGEEVAPTRVVGQDPDVEHVRVGQDRVRSPPDRRAILARRVAVVDRVSQRGRSQLREAARLILRERLGRIEVESARTRVAGEHVQDREVEAERLPARGSRRHDRVALRHDALPRLRLVREESADAVPRECLFHVVVKFPRYLAQLGFVRRLVRARDETLVLPREQPLERERPVVGLR